MRNGATAISDDPEAEAVTVTISGNRAAANGAGIYYTHASDVEGAFERAGTVLLNNVMIMDIDLAA